MGSRDHLRKLPSKLRTIDMGGDHRAFWDDLQYIHLKDYKKMLENRPEDALDSLVETEKTVETEETEKVSQSVSQSVST